MANAVITLFQRFLLQHKTIQIYNNVKNIQLQTVHRSIVNNNNDNTCGKYNHRMLVYSNNGTVCW